MPVPGLGVQPPLGSGPIIELAMEGRREIRSGAKLLLMKTTFIHCLAIILWIQAEPALSENWPAWRGPEGDGVTSETDLPLHWDRQQNVQWRTPLPGPGNSTPIVWEDRIFVTQAIGPDRRVLMCYQTDRGELQWEAGVEVRMEERTHDTNPYASASPVTDGERVICWFGSGGIVAYDFGGNELWRTDLGRHSHRFGYGGSPVMHEEFVYLNFGPGTREFLLALNKNTGEEVWRHESSVLPQDDIYGMWSTPCIAKWQEEPQLISALRGELAGLHPATGDVIWFTDAVGIQAKSSPIAGQGVVVMSGDMESAEVAVRLGGEGDVTDSHILWRRDPPKRRIAAGIISGDVIYGVQTAGIADCVELRTGGIVWQERLQGSGANNAVWSSPMMSGDRIYVMNQNGDVFVYRAAKEFERLAMNSLGETSNSSVVPAEGRLYLRTHEALWSIGP